MYENEPSDLSLEIIAKARGFGADLAGIARVDDLKNSPSHVISEKMPAFANVAAEMVEGRKPGIVEWPDGARSAIVIALSHPPEKPELDWRILEGNSSTGNTPGNKLLMATVKKLAEWLEKEKGATCFALPYYIEHGGIYMKDTAVLAGLGCIGKNNMLVTPEYGPRSRLRIVLVDIDLPATGPLEFDPCTDCSMPCRTDCPVNAFSKTLYSREEYDLDRLPGRSGVYSRPLCRQQMDENMVNCTSVAAGGSDTQEKITKFCRQCEFSCPVGVD